MTLPELPKKNKTKEASFGLRFKSWWKANKKKLQMGSYELKDTRGKDYLPYDEITNEQFKSGLANKSEDGNLIRVVSGTVGTADYILLKKSEAYVVIKYPKFFCFIDIETLINTKVGKSLSSEKALHIATISVIHRS